MKRMFVFIFLGFFLSGMTATAQTAGPVSDNFFPAEPEFKELKTVSSDLSFTDPSRLSTIANGKLIEDVGFRKYESRTYALGGASTLSIQVITLMDTYAAYSLSTLLGNSPMQSGPPGDVYSSDSNRTRFAQNRYWVEIRGRNAPAELMKQVALSVSNRIGPRDFKRPSLVSHFPKSGYDASSLKYFPGFKSFETYTGKRPDWSRYCGRDVEIARANYSLEDHTGVLSILNFPTDELAEEFYSKLARENTDGNVGNVYFKRVSSLVGILEGPFSRSSADKVLDSIHYNYSIRWIYEKSKKPAAVVGEKSKKPSAVFGIPTGILGTVVKSFFFAGILIVSTVVAGFLFAVVRFRFRNRMSQKSLNDEITHLRMR